MFDAPPPMLLMINGVEMFSICNSQSAPISVLHERAIGIRPLDNRDAERGIAEISIGIASVVRSSYILI